jgi:hypothetical protein
MNISRKTVVLEMTFGNMTHYDRFVRDVQEDRTLTPNILRGRVAPDGTWMRVELRGASRKIENVVGRWKDFIVAAGKGPELGLRSA